MPSIQKSMSARIDAAIAVTRLCETLRSHPDWVRISSAAWTISALLHWQPIDHKRVVRLLDELIELEGCKANATAVIRVRVGEIAEALKFPLDDRCAEALAAYRAHGNEFLQLIEKLRQQEPAPVLIEVQHARG